MKYEITIYKYEEPIPSEARSLLRAQVYSQIINEQIHDDALDVVERVIKAVNNFPSQK